MPRARIGTRPGGIRERADQPPTTLSRRRARPMRDARLDRRQALAVLGATFGLPQFASAQQGWPARSVRYVLGFAAGGPTDTLSRVFCQKMIALTDHKFLFANRFDAGCNVVN